MPDGANDGEQYEQGADDRAGGTHGRGVGVREQHLGEGDVEPGVRKSSDPPGAVGDPAWANEASGGSTIDRRPPEHKGGSGKR